MEDFGCYENVIIYEIGRQFVVEMYIKWIKYYYGYLCSNVYLNIEGE